VRDRTVFCAKPALNSFSRIINLLDLKVGTGMTASSDKVASTSILENARYQVEFRLRERERFLRTLIGNLPGVVYRCRVDENFTSEFISDGCFDLTGYTADELTQTRIVTWDNIIHPDDRERIRHEVRQLIENVALNKPPFQITYRIIKRDQTIRHVRDRFRFVNNSFGAISALEGFIADVTERTLAEERVRETEARYRLLAENIRDLVCLHELDGRYLYISPSSHALLGYSPSELIGTSLYDLIHEDEITCVRDDLHERLLHGENHLTADYRMRHKSGEYVWLETMAQVIADKSGNQSQLLTVSRDISKRKVAEQERAAAQEEIAGLFLSEQVLRQEAENARTDAERANRAKDEFLQLISHEFRTPLTTIKTLTRVMQQDGESKAERDEYLETIAAECDRQIDMILNLLDVARIEEGKVDLRSEPVDINRVLRACHKIEQHGAFARHQILNVEYNEDLPLVRGDEKALRRALCAIIENSIKYTPYGGMISVLPRFQATKTVDDETANKNGSEIENKLEASQLTNIDEADSARTRDEQVSVTICDTGRGIHETDIPKLFQKFFRGEKPVPHDVTTDGTSDDAAGRAATPGVGLGLYLTKRLIDELGGRIDVHSEVGRGTCFTIYLPIWNEGYHQLDPADEYGFDEGEIE
jgi:PAS domain S-box-containing protein